MGVKLCANARANCGARRALGVSIGDCGVAVGVGFLGGVRGVTRTRSDVLGPRAHPDLGVTVRAGLGGLFASAGDLAVAALAGRTRLSFCEWNRRVPGVRFAVTQGVALTVVDVIDSARWILDVGVPEEGCRGVFVVGFGSALARGACIERRDFAERLELTLGANVQRSGETALEEVFAQSQRWAGEVFRCALATVDAFDREGGGVLLAGGVDRDLFAFSEDSVAGDALGVGFGELRAGKQLGGVGGDFGQHRSATSQSSVWKASR